MLQLLIAERERCNYCVNQSIYALSPNALFLVKESDFLGEVTMLIALNLIKRHFSATVTYLAALGYLTSTAMAQELNYQSHYLHNGVTVSHWQLALGDASSWYQPQNSDLGLSANKAVSYNYQDKSLHVRWRAKGKPGLISINGEAIDLSQLDDSIGLALELKVHTHKLNNPIELSMTCGYPCRAR